MQIRGDVRVYSGIFLMALAAVAAIVLFVYKSKPTPKINSFEQCAAAGYKVSNGYPRECTLPTGKFFVEQVVPGR